MTTHTPGPWHVGTRTILDNHGFKVNAFPVAGNGQAIAAIWAGSVGKEAFGFDNQEANARLIAAAPDMLAALKGWIAFCDNLQGKPATMTSAAYMDVLRDIARAAIAKAEGTS